MKLSENSKKNSLKIVAIDYGCKKNILELLNSCGFEVIVVPCNYSTEKIMQYEPLGIFLSNGPGDPFATAKYSIKIIQELIKIKIPIFGICLGHQTIGAAFGAKIIRANNIMHGKIDKIMHQDNSDIFKDIPTTFDATRYHSLIIKDDSLPPTLSILARSSDNCIMGIKHKRLPIFGVQFHPESIKTNSGKKILSNFLKIIEDNGKRKN